MTQDDLDKMRDVTNLNCALFQKEEDGTFEDIYGVTWLTGWLNGEHVKRVFGAVPRAAVNTRHEPGA